MTGHTPQEHRQSSRAAAAVAVAAAVAGAVLVVVGVIRLIGQLEAGATAAQSSATFVTTTTSRPTDPMSTTAEPEATSPLTDLVTLSDETGAVSVSMPAEWDDVSGSAWSVDGTVVGLSIGASTDRSAWYEGWGTPGAFVGVTTVGPDVYSPVLGDFGGVCTLAATYDREYVGFTAVVQRWVDCGEEGSEFHVALVWPDSFEYAAMVQVVTVERSGAEVIDTLITTIRHDP